MKYFIDLGHPAHVHYFRNFIKSMEKKGHGFFVSARNRNIIHYLLDHYKISYYNRGKGKNSLAGKILYMLVADFRLLRKALYFKPDIFISFASPYASQVAWFLRKPNIVLDDTEHARFVQALYKPFSSVFLNPCCFYKDFGRKQIRFNSFIELLYLHPDHFQPDENIYDLLGLKKGEKFILLRLVSWEAHHDIGHSGLSRDKVNEIVNYLKKDFRIFVSKEKSGDDFLKEYELDIPYEKIHDVLYFADLFIAESGTMASEAALLGTPVIYINSLPLMGYLKEEKNIGLLQHFKNQQGLMERIGKLVQDPNHKKSAQEKARSIITSKINPTEFLSWFIENYPQSQKIMKKNKDFQNRFL